VYYAYRRKKGPDLLKSRRDIVSSASNRKSPRMAAAAPWHVFSLLLSLRIVNSLVIRTFFQPDEYFQSLEPAWRLAFGGDSGAWITWVRI
jgi:phosphatidylinositol glycan class B